MIKARVFVSFKPSVFDPESKVICNTLNSLGYLNVIDTKVNKFFELTFNETDHEIVKQQLSEISKNLLVNPNIENYTFELYPTTNAEVK